jgi:hypothetical protein
VMLAAIPALAGLIAPAVRRNRSPATNRKGS